MRQRSSKNFVKHRVETQACNPSTEKTGQEEQGFTASLRYPLRPSQNRRSKEKAQVLGVELSNGGGKALD